MAWFGSVCWFCSFGLVWLVSLACKVCLVWLVRFVVVGMVCLVWLVWLDVFVVFGLISLEWMFIFGSVWFGLFG